MPKFTKTFTNNGNIGYELLFNDEMHRFNYLLHIGSAPACNKVWNGDTEALSDQLRQRYPDFSCIEELIYVVNELLDSESDTEIAEAMLKLTALEHTIRIMHEG